MAQYTPSQLRAMDKAHDQARAGNLPTLTETSFDGTAIRETWNVHSRTGQNVYAVSLTHSRAGIATECSCPAAGACWHRAAARLAHQDAIPSACQTWGRIRPRQQVAS